MPGATSEGALAAMLIGPLTQATKYVVDKIMETNEEVVESVVYSAYSPTMYDRTGELKTAWLAEANSRGSSGVTGSFEYDPSQISAYSALTGESVPYLADIVFNGLAGHLFGEGPWTASRDAWNALLKAIGNNQIYRWMAEGMAAAGLSVHGHGGSVKA